MRVFFLALAPLAALPLAAEADGNVTPMSEVRAKFMKELEIAESGYLKLYELQLARMEKEAALKGDYESAAAWRQEIVAMRNKAQPEEPPPKVAEPAPPPETPVPRDFPLRPSAASLIGSVKMDDLGNLVSWTPESKAQWKTNDLPPGGYEVIISFDGLNGKTACLLREEFYYLEGSLSGAEGDGVQSVNLGTLRVSVDSRTVTVSFPSLPAASALRVRGIELLSARR